MPNSSGLMPNSSRLMPYEALLIAVAGLPMPALPMVGALYAVLPYPALP